VYRDQKGEIPCLPQAELASRCAKQLLRVGMSVACVRGKEVVTEDEFRIMKRIALDSLPSNRRLLVTALWQNRQQARELGTFAAAVSRVSQSTLRVELDNLTELGAVVRSKVGKAYDYQLAPSFQEYGRNIGGLA
jgi:hypothetical protein